MPLSKLRQKIDKLDLKILRLLNERASIIREIGQVKKEHQLPVYDAQREQQILAAMTTTNRGPMNNESVENIFKMIILECRKIQTDFLVAEEDV